MIVIFFFIQCIILSQIPFNIGKILKLIHLSFLYSIYCFEFKWGTDSHLMKNLAFFEENFAYFTGFGFLFAISTIYLPFFLSTGLFVSLFPIFLLTAIRATPLNASSINSIFDLHKLFKKNEVSYVLISKFEYDSNKYENNFKKIGFFTFPRIMIKYLHDLIEKLLKNKLN